MNGGRKEMNTSPPDSGWLEPGDILRKYRNRITDNLFNVDN